MTQLEQSKLPLLDQYTRTVWYMPAKEVTVKRRFFKDKVISELLESADELFSERRIATIDIAKFGDAVLRYALRFQDAAEATREGHFVTIEATDEGFNSRLLWASYTGNPKEFEQSLLSGAKED